MIILSWADLPLNVRSNVMESSGYNYRDDTISAVAALQLELDKYHCTYTYSNDIIFRSEKDYNWFILKWSQ
jgi:chlorite dismutase